MIRCEEVDELLGAYALGALTPDEQAQVTEHLDGCDKHPEAAEMRAVAAAFALSAPEREPPAALKSRIMAEVRGETPRPADDPGPGPLERLRGVLRTPWLPYLASGAAIAAVALFALYFGLVQDEDGGSRSVYTLSGEGGISGELVVEPGDTPPVMTVNGLDPLPDGQTYQIWALGDGRPAPAGFLAINATGEAIGIVTTDLSQANAVAVTIEPAGGSLQPTSDPVLTGDL